MQENTFKTNLIKEIKAMLPGCFVYHLDPNELQGSPDLLILYEDKWATLEVKISRDAPHQPNQNYYVDIMNKLSFSSFIFPENKEEVLNELYEAFKPSRPARFSRGQ